MAIGQNQQRPATPGHRTSAAQLLSLARPGAARIASEIARENAALARLVIAHGFAGPDDVAAAGRAARAQGQPIGQILRARGIITETELLSTLAEIHHIALVDLEAEPPEPGLARLLPADRAIAAEAVVWRHIGTSLVVAATQPSAILALSDVWPDGTRILRALAPRDQILAAQADLYGAQMARVAEARAPAAASCRGWRGVRVARWAAIFATALVILALIAPVWATGLVFGLAGLVFACNLALKLASFMATFRARNDPPEPSPPKFLDPPTVSLLVPLFHEPEIAGALVRRLQGLDYPRDRLDVLLIVEEEDAMTLAALRSGHLPPWMRAITVPLGTPRTKPRALNYALPFARGSIIGIYDAEDRPEPDQINRIVAQFAQAASDIACLQGRLDYYNAHHNLMSRCFAVEYAAWFRVLLPGVARLGLVVPLGGTTLFLRRDVLERVGGWDAHNVTEDAELGLRLARSGYRTALVETTTFEEANAAALPWIRQRSRWLKGYLLTWATAMRSPRALWRDLGPKRFIGFQVQFLSGVLGYITAPLLWSLLVKTFGLAHPLDALLGPVGYGVAAVVMALGFFLSLAVSIHACRVEHLRSLRPMAPILEPYYLLGSLAGWLAVIELMARPFFWAKTAHGRFSGTIDDGVSGAAPLPSDGP